MDESKVREAYIEAYIGICAEEPQEIEVTPVVAAIRKALEPVEKRVEFNAGAYERHLAKEHGELCDHIGVLQGNDSRGSDLLFEAKADIQELQKRVDRLETIRAEAPKQPDQPEPRFKLGTYVTPTYGFPDREAAVVEEIDFNEEYPYLLRWSDGSHGRWREESLSQAYPPGRWEVGGKEWVPEICGHPWVPEKCEHPCHTNKINRYVFRLDGLSSIRVGDGSIYIMKYCPECGSALDGKGA